MQALKGLVIFMGILIAIGVTVIGVTIYRRATDMVTTDKAVPAGSQTPGAPEPLAQGAESAGWSIRRMPENFGVRALDLPAGSDIVSVQPTSQGIIVHARLPGGASRILVLDPASGALRGEWRMDGATP